MCQPEENDTHHHHREPNNPLRAAESLNSGLLTWLNICFVAQFGCGVPHRTGLVFNGRIYAPSSLVCRPC